jgi:hypothetical protein
MRKHELFRVEKGLKYFGIASGTNCYQNKSKSRIFFKNVTSPVGTYLLIPQPKLT